MAVRIAPVVRQQFFDNQGRVAAGMQLFTYTAGTTTKRPTYTTADGNVENDNPIELDAAGRTPDGVWLTDNALYKFVLAPANDTDPPTSPVWTEDKIQSNEPVLSNFSNTSNVALGDALIGFKQSNANGALTGASARTVHQKLQELISVKDFGATGDGATDDSAAIQAAIDAVEGNGGGTLYFPLGTYMAHDLDTADHSRVLLVGDGRGSILKKNANGPVLTLGAECATQWLSIEGNGGSYTGVGIFIDTGGLNQTSWRAIDHCYIFDTESYGIEFDGNRSGYASQISHCRIIPTDQDVAAVKYPTVVGASENNGNRSMEDVWSASNPLVDFGSSNDSQLCNCQGGVPLFSQHTQKACITGNRLVQYSGGPTWTIDGTQNTITGNTLSLTAGANTVTFNSTLNGTTFRANSASSATYVDNATGSSLGNYLDIPNTVYTPTWTSTAGAITVGDASINAAYQRDGNRCTFNIQFTYGSTTSTPSDGIWKFSLPYTPARDEACSLWIQDGAGTPVYVGQGYIQAGSPTVWMLAAGATAGWVNDFRPITFNNGDKIRISGSYSIQ